MLSMDEEILGNFGRYTFITGILLILLGTVAMFLPTVMSLGTVIFIALLLIIGGFFWAIHSFRYDSKRVMNWFKPVLLFGVGGLLLFYPASGVAAVGLLLAL